MFGSASAPLPLPLVWCGQEPWKDTEGGGANHFMYILKVLASPGMLAMATTLIWTSFWAIQLGPVVLEDCVIVPVFFLRAS